MEEDSGGLGRLHNKPETIEQLDCAINPRLHIFKYGDPTIIRVNFEQKRRFIRINDSVTTRNSSNPPENEVEINYEDKRTKDRALRHTKDRRPTP